MNPNEINYSQHDPLIVVRIWDGIGNQLFQYAFARALKERGRNVALDLGKSYEKELFGFTASYSRNNEIQQFNITLPSMDVEAYGKYEYLKRDTLLHKAEYSLSKHGLWKYRYLRDSDATYSEEIDGIKGNCYLTGWFQSERYFRGIRDILLHDFSLKKEPSINSPIREYMDDPECVALHVRRGDYVRYNWDLPVEYYKRADKKLRERFSDPKYLVFSDNIKWARENLGFLKDALFVDRSYGYADYEELVLMSMCGSNIISNSTFSWWGAWLNRNEDKTVIAPAKWPGGQSVDIVPKEWIIV